MIDLSSIGLRLKSRITTLLLLTGLLAASPRATAQATSPQATETTSTPIPFAELGAKATADYKGDAIGITTTADGAELRTGFQKLAGTVTSEGLRLSSTEAEGGSLQLTASAVGRVHGATQALSATGSVASTDTLVSFTRPGLVEEYSVSADGVRQDFIIAQRPAGAGALSVELALSGATAEAAADGAKLTLAGSGRALAYSRLHVTDASGQVLSATLDVLSPTKLAVRVQDNRAVYPVRIDPTFSDADWVSLNPGIPGANGTVRAMVVDGGGNLVVGGDFTFIGAVEANRIAKWDGSAWSALGSGMNGTVYALAVSGSEIFAGGYFTLAGGTPLNYIAKWNGSAWSALGSGMNYYVTALVVSGSDLYAGGHFIMAGGTGTNRIAKWNGSAWSALGAGMNQPVTALAVSGTDLYAGGTFTTAGGTGTNHIAKWNGSAWSALGTGANDSVRTLAVSGSDLYVGGDFTNAGGASANRIAKWNGSAWSALGSGMNDSVFALAVTGSDLYAGGNFTSAGGASANRIAKWNGSAWSALGSGMNDSVFALAVNGSDLYAGGDFTSAGATAASRIAKWNGSVWSALGSGMDVRVNALAVSGSDLYAGGDFTSAGATAASGIAKWNGSAWSALGSGMDGGVYELAVSGSDLYAGGGFTTAGGVNANRIAKWNGSAWSALGSGMNDSVFALAVSGKNLYAGGAFTTAGGKTANFIAKWNGSAWSALGSGMGGEVYELAVSGKNLYVGGSFTRAGGKTANSIAKWNGSAWSALGSGTDGSVSALAVSGNDLYVGGSFETAGGRTANSIAKWKGSEWSGLGRGVNDSVYALAVSGSELYAGGNFNVAGGNYANNIAKWDGSAWSALGKGMNREVYALAIDTANHLYVAGNFNFAGTIASPFIVQANLPPLVTAIAPTSGSTGGGTRLTITGKNFNGATAVTIGGNPATNLVVVNASTITCIIPAGTDGLASVVVTTQVGSNNPNTLFTYVTSEMAISGNSMGVPNADTTPSLADHTDFGTVLPLNQQVTRRFTIANSGTGPLVLTSTTQVQITGAAAADFKVKTQPTTIVASGGSTYFDTTFDPTLSGLRTALVTITSNAPANPTFTFAIAGFGGLSQTITFAPPATLYPGQSPFALNTYSSSGLPVDLRVVSGPAIVIDNTLFLTGTGTVKLEATQPGGGNYAAARPVLKTIFVKADPPVLTLIDLAQTYDGMPKLIATLGGGVATITYKIGSAFGAIAPTNAGSYPVSAVAGGVTKTGTLVIAKAPLYVTPEDKHKFAGKANPALTYTTTGFQGTDTAAVLTKAPTLKTTATTTSPGGTYSITASGATALNYNIIYQQGTMVVDSFAGSYEALLVDGSSLPIAKLSLIITAPGTAFTAKLSTATETSALSFKGSVDTNPVTERATGTATVTKAGVPYVINFTLPLGGNLSADATRNSIILGSATNGQKLSTATVLYAGAHTAVLEPATGGSAPGGAGWATAIISTKGVLTLKGKLGDGTAFTAAVSPDALSDPGYRLWVQPYLPARTQSYLAGAFSLIPHPTLANRRYLDAADLTWKKTGLPADASYRTSFGPVNTAFMVDPWMKPVAATKTLPAITLLQRLGLSAPNFAVTHSLANADLPTRLALSTTNKVSVQTPDTNLTKWKTLTFNTTDGTFTGSFVLPVGTVPFSGVLRQPADNLDALIGDGHYLLPPPSGTEKSTGELRFQRP